MTPASKKPTLIVISRVWSNMTVDLRVETILGPVLRDGSASNPKKQKREDARSAECGVDLDPALKDLLALV